MHDLVLKEIILKRLDLTTKIDATRFRAVCKSWRSSILRIERNPLLLPDRFEIGDHESRFHFPSESTVYHIAPTPDDPSTSKHRGWLIRLDRDGKLLHPLSQTNYMPFLPKVLNSLDFRISELARTYCSGKGHWNKIVALNSYSPAVMLLRTKKLYHGQLALHVDGKLKLQIMNNQNSPIDDIDDVIIHQGKFYAVSQFGEIMGADSSGNVESVTSTLQCSVINWECDRWKMYLVESVGEVLLVQRLGPRFVAKGDPVDNVLKRKVKFKVYKLDELEKRWIQMAAFDLSDRILFLADDLFSFSVSAKDFAGCRGSCICFSYKHRDARVVAQNISSA